MSPKAACSSGRKRAGPVLTLSLPVPTERFIASQDDLVVALRVAIADAGELLGFSR